MPRQPRCSGSGRAMRAAEAADASSGSDLAFSHLVLDLG